MGFAVGWIIGLLLQFCTICGTQNLFLVLLTLNLTACYIPLRLLSPHFPKKSLLLGIWRPTGENFRIVEGGSGTITQIKNCDGIITSSTPSGVVHLFYLNQELLIPIKLETAQAVFFPLSDAALESTSIFFKSLDLIFFIFFFVCTKLAHSHPTQRVRKYVPRKLCFLARVPEKVVTDDLQVVFRLSRNPLGFPTSAAPCHCPSAKAAPPAAKPRAHSATGRVRAPSYRGCLFLF